MAGGTWKTQDKIRAGAYINFTDGAITESDLSVKEKITMPLILDFGPEKQIFPISKGTNLDLLISSNKESELLIKEALKQAKIILACRVNVGEIAKATVNENVDIKAIYSGELGNSLSVTSKKDINNAKKFIIQTFLKGKLVDSQSVTSFGEFKSNGYITITGETVAEFTTSLENGTNGTTTAKDYADYFKAIETYDFPYMALPVDDTAIKTAGIEFVKTLREDEGLKCQIVVATTAADSEMVINVANGVILADGTKVPAKLATAWVAGASANCSLGESLTYKTYDGAVDALPRMTSTETVSELILGGFLFTLVRGEARVEKDINSLYTFTEEKRSVWSKNEAVRTFDHIANDTKEVFEDFYIGKVQNDELGREAFRADRITFLSNLEATGSIQNFDKDTVQVAPGEDKDAMLLTAEVEVLNTLEKLYMNVSVK